MFDKEEIIQGGIPPETESLIPMDPVLLSRLILEQGSVEILTLVPQ